MNEYAPVRVLLAAAILLLAACGQSESPAPVPEPTAADDAQTTKKIPITTDSERAREAYEQGRHLLERVRNTDAHEYFTKAVGEDPDFAIGWWGVAITAPSASEFFDAMARATELADTASEGERLIILAQDAAARGDAAAQLDYLQKLVAAYPGDARSHNALAVLLFARQDYEAAIEHFGHATSLDPDNPAPYNSLGYAYRALGDFDAAEKAFLRNIELISGEPNPYDSYAELLMKMGRYKESIEQYRKALEIDPNFIASLIGIGNNQIFMGDSAAARDSFQELMNRARNQGEKRQAVLWMAMSHVYDGNHDAALGQLQEMYAIAEAAENLPGMAGDLITIGNVALDAGYADRALGYYRQAEATMERANVAFDVKEGARRNLSYFAARVALAKEDIEEARTLTSQYEEAVQARAIPVEQRRVHELKGMIALRDEDYGSALEHLGQANQRDPRVLYLLAKAHAGAGNADTASELMNRVATFNEPNPQWAFVRDEALATDGET